MSDKLKFPNSYNLNSDVLESLNRQMSESTQRINDIKNKEKQDYKEFTEAITSALVDLVSKQTQMIETQQVMIEEGRKDSKETRLYSIISIVLAIIAIVISIVLR